MEFKASAVDFRAGQGFRAVQWILDRFRGFYGGAVNIRAVQWNLGAVH